MQTNQSTAPATVPQVHDVEILTPGMIEELLDRIPQYDTTELDRCVEVARTIEAIETPDDRALAGMTVVDIDECTKKFSQFIAPYKKTAHALHKGITAIEKDVPAKPAAEADRLRRLSQAYDREQKRIAEAKAEAERKKAEEAARKERERIEAEAQAEAERLAEEGNNDAAEAALNDALDRAAQAEQQAMMAPPAAPAPRVETGGLRTREKWVAKVTNIDAFIEYAASPEGKWARVYLMENGSTLGAAARSMKSKLKIPGVDVYDEGTTVRSGR